MLSSSEGWGAYVLAPRCKLRRVPMPYIQLMHVLLMYLGLFYMLDRPCFFLLAIYSTANVKSLPAIAASFWGLHYHLCLIIPGWLPIIFYIGLSSKDERRRVWEGKGKKPCFFLEKRANNSLTCMGFNIYPTYFGTLICESAENT